MAILSSAGAQLDPFKGMNMRSIGPGVTSGRVTAIDVNQEQGIVYIGSASGGVWKSENQGIQWTPLFDGQDAMGIGALKISPVNGDEIWVGTGEGNPRNSQTSGRGIYRSLDRGKTWKKMGLEETKSIHRICISDQNEVYAGAMGSAWGPSEQRGVFKYNSEKSEWRKILYVNDSTGCADLVMDPTNHNKLFAAMWQYQRKPWNFHSGGKGSGLYMTHDGGGTWKLLGEKEGLPAGPIGRIGVGISASDSRIIYALIEAKKTGLYRSDDGGYHWRLVTENGVGDRPFYYSEFYVDPNDSNHLIYLHSIVSESIDGGKTWNTIIPYWGVHPDHHAFWWNTKNSNDMWEGNDGGLNHSPDGGKSWEFIPNLPLGQFYHVQYDHETPYHVYGGLQDNGTWKAPAYVWHSDGILDSDWQELYFGDGFDAIPDPTDENWVYVLSQGGDLARVNSVTGEERSIQPVHPEGKPLRFHWNTGIAADPFLTTGIYIGSQYLHYSDNQGKTWTLLSPDLTSNDATKLEAYKSGGLTTDATSAENYCTILCIAPSSFDANTIWVGTDDGKIQVTKDRGKSWNEVQSKIPGFPKQGWIPQLVLSESNPNEVWVVVNNYRQNDWKPYLFHSMDNGLTWENCVNSSSIPGHCLSVVQDRVSPNLVFLGTEFGMYVSLDHGKKWNKWTHDYPSVATQDLRIHSSESDLIIATFGRGIYVLDDLEPLRMAASNGRMLSDSLVVFNPEPAYQAHYKRHLGQRFPGDQYFSGDNRPFGMKINCIVKQPKFKEGQEKTKLMVSIINESGDTVRQFTQEPDSFLTQIHWHFDQDGFSFPTRGKREKKKEKPGGGWKVNPGYYRVVVKYGHLTQEALGCVMYDPREQGMSEASEVEKQQLYNEWKAVVLDLDKEVERVKKSKELVEWALESVKYQDDSLTRKWKQAGDSLVKHWNARLDVVFMPEGLTGIQDGSRYISGQWWVPFGLINNNAEGPNDNARRAIENLKMTSLQWKQGNQSIWEKEWDPFVHTLTPYLKWPAGGVN